MTRAAWYARRWVKGTIFGVALLLAVLVGLYALMQYAFYDPSTDTRATVIFAKQPVAIVLHAVGASFAPLIGLLQWSTRLRRRWPMLHRWLGRVYLVMGVAIGGSAALWLSFFAYGGPLARTGVAAMGVLWIFVSMQAFLFIRRGDVYAHRVWMLLSVALAMGAATLRVYLPLLTVADVPFLYAYWFAAWGSWLSKLAIAELLLRRERATRSATLRVPAART